MKSKTLKQERKPEKLFNIIDKVLRQIFGETATVFIYKYLEEKHSLKREHIPSELELFTEGLEKYLSHYGSSVVLQALFNKSSGLELMKAEERNFVKQLKELKRLS